MNIIMNNKFSTIIVVFMAFSYVEASCSLLDGLCLKKSVADLDGLNRYLVDKIPETAKLSDNLDHIKANIHRLEGARMREAAQLVLEVSKLDKGCTPETMSILVQMGEAKVNPEGEKRVEKVLREAGLKDRVDDCVVKVDEIRMDLHFKSNHRYFTSSFTPPLYYWKNKVFIPRIGQDWIIRKVSKLGKHDPSTDFIQKKNDEITGKPVFVKDSAKFESAFDTYLLKPCKELMADSSLDMLFDGVQALKKLGVRPYRIRITAEETMRLGWIMHTCNKYLAMNSAGRARLLRNYSPTRVEESELK